MLTAIQPTRFGVLATTPVEGERGLATLADEERAHALSLPELRRATWIAGRVALRAALSAQGLSAPAILPDERGAPRLPPEIAGSIAHKESVALALVERRQGPGHVGVGVDVEYDRAARVDIEGRVLSPLERERISGLEPADRARAVRVAFALKEAIYKAIDPACRRYVGFKEVELLDLSSLTPGSVSVCPRLAPDPGPLRVSAAWLQTTDPAGQPLIVAFASAARGAP